MLSDHKRVRSFGSGPVGLRIVAAMIHDPKPVATSPKKSDPIMIYPSVGPTDETEEEDMEEYTCVTTRVGGRAVRMRVYLDSGSGPAGEEVLGDCGEFGREGGVFSESVGGDVGHDDGLEFLRRCYLCRKKLHGLDIFMYRGDKAFCSEECRYQQILSDEHKAKCKTKSGKSFDYSVSPYPSPLLFAAGVAAA